MGQKRPPAALSLFFPSCPYFYVLCNDKRRRILVFWPKNDKTVIIVFWSFVFTFQMVRVRLPRRNFCVRLRHNALSGLDIFKINLFRAKFRRYALAAGVIQLNHL
jgi:hypothetical protein